MSNKKETKVDEFENVEHALTASELFIEKNRNKILYIVGAVAAVVLIVLGVNNFVVKPREVQAANEMAKTSIAFARDSFALALNGDGIESIGYLEINDQYGSTSSGKLAAAYAGICYFHLGQYENAIDYLKKYSGDDEYFSVAVQGMIGDAYVELGETEKAIGYFEDAASEKNDVLSPIYLKKAGIAYESLGKADEALESYTEIKDNYPASAESSDIEKYIARVSK